ncbi:Cysteine-rich protein 2-binding protein [Entomortierella beljakovae]|nr:Cysteine-rich protein 2-binding protein [Entomortierella beljakovae]
MLPCQKCGQLFHSGCVSCLTKPLLKGDEFFKFECSVCNQGAEVFERAALSWAILVHLVLYNLMDAHPEQQYFRWKEEICKFIDDYWSYLLPDKERMSYTNRDEPIRHIKYRAVALITPHYLEIESPTWNNTVASVLSVQSHIFRSGMEIKGASGWWTLFEKSPPDRNRKLKPKNKTSSQRAPGAPRPLNTKSKEKKAARIKSALARKKTRFDETSSDDDFHTNAKPRPQSSAPTTRIKSRQFSLSSGSSLSSAGDSDDSLDEDDIFWKSDEEEKEIRLEVYLHGIPACIQHHFNPSGLDFSEGPIHLEEIFRLTDLIDENSTGKLIHRVNSLGAMSAGGKKKKGKSSIVEYKSETARKAIERRYSNDSSDNSGDDVEEEVEISTDESDVDSEQGSDSDDLHETQSVQKHTGGKRFSHSMASKNIYSGLSSGGKHGRKSSLKDPLLSPKQSRKSKKNVSMSEDIDVSFIPLDPMYIPKNGGGKKFSQAHIDAMTRAMMSSSPSKPGPKPKPKAKPPKPKTSSNAEFRSEPSLESLSLTDNVPNPPPTLTPQQLQGQQEWHILQILEDASKSKALPTVAARFKRKLHLKRLKTFLQLPLFDMEDYMRQHLSSPFDLTCLSKSIPLDPYDLRRLREEEFRTKIQKIDHTPYGNSFASRLLGQPVECLTRKPWEPLWKSSFSGKVLNDYIWRDYESRSVMMDILDDIKVRQGRPTKPPTRLNFNSKKRKNEESIEQLDRQEHGGRSPIDYCYFRKEHLAQVNETLCRRFWPGIDMTEALQYPEYSVVVLYKRLVVGCAFMTPEGYITYVAVSAGWEKAGIGQFMLYHLIQASRGKDITLHVSANNPAMASELFDRLS